MTIWMPGSVPKYFVVDFSLTYVALYVGEVGAEEVVDNGGVGSADVVGEAEYAVDLDGWVGGGGEEVGDPVGDGWWVGRRLQGRREGSREWGKIQWLGFLWWPWRKIWPGIYISTDIR